MTQNYEWRGGEEQWLRHGVAHAHQILIIEPLFEEVNRCRRLIVEVMRGLDARGIGATLPDLPGTGESLTPISSVSLTQWREAVKAVETLVEPVVTATFRAGTLLAGTGIVWRFAPETGARIVRDLRRAQLTSASASSLYAGHALSQDLIDQLDAATSVQHRAVRTVRLDSDAGDADVKLSGTPLWRRAEPGEDAALAVAIVDDLSAWVMSCAAS